MNRCRHRRLLLSPPPWSPLWRRPRRRDLRRRRFRSAARPRCPWRRSGPGRGRCQLPRQDRARRVGGQQRGNEQGAAGAESRQYRRKRYPDLAAFAAARKRTEPRRRDADTITGYRATNRVTVRLREISKMAGVIHPGQRRRQRNRQHQLHGLHLETARRGACPGDRRRPAQGGDLCQGCGRFARGASAFPRKAVAARRCSAARWPPPMAGRRRWRRARRRCRVTVSVSWAIKPKE